MIDPLKSAEALLADPKSREMMREAEKDPDFIVEELEEWAKSHDQAAIIVASKADTEFVFWRGIDQKPHVLEELNSHISCGSHPVGFVVNIFEGVVFPLNVMPLAKYENDREVLKYLSLVREGLLARVAEGKEIFPAKDDN